MAKYLVIHTYLPDYGIQGTPILIPMSLIKLWGLQGKNWVREEKKRAVDHFLRWNMRPIGRIHPHHRPLADNIEWDVKYKELNADQVHHYQFLTRGKLHFRRYTHKSMPKERSRRRVHKFSKLHRRF